MAAKGHDQVNTSAMRTITLIAILLAAPAAAQPPFQGTVFIDPDVLTAADPTSFAGVEHTGRGERTLWDYRVMDWITVDAYLFDVRYEGRFSHGMTAGTSAGAAAARRAGA